jgi:WD40 repeat protein
MQSGKCLATFSSSNDDPDPIHAQLSPDGKLLAVDPAGEIRLFDVVNRCEFATIRQTDDEHPLGYQFAFSPDGRFLAFDMGRGAAGRGGAHQEAFIVLWDIPAKQTSLTLEGAWPIAFSPDGTMLAAHETTETPDGARDGRVVLWQVPKGKRLARLAIPNPPDVDLYGTGFGLEALEFSPNGAMLVGVCCQRMASGGASCGFVEVWDVPTGRERFTLKNSHRISFSKDGRFLATADAVDLRTGVEIWDLTTGAKDSFLEVYGGLVDGRWAGHRLLGDGRSMAIWYEENLFAPPAERRWPWQEPAPTSGPRSILKVVDLKTEATRAQLEAWWVDILFSPDASTMAKRCDDGSIELWDMPPRKPVVEILAISLGAALLTFLLGLLARRVAS